MLVQMVAVVPDCGFLDFLFVCSFETEMRAFSRGDNYSAHVDWALNWRLLPEIVIALCLFLI